MLKNSFKRKPEIKVETAKIEKEKVTTLLELANFHIQEFSELVKVGLRSNETLKQWNSTRKKIFEFIIYTFKSYDPELSQIEYLFAKKNSKTS